LPDPEACTDKRPPALRASDRATEAILYNNWLRGLLGSSDSEVAKKYGRLLYETRALSWGEHQSIKNDPALREVTINHKADQWRNFAGRIRTEDPGAYEYLTGARGMERIGAGFIALLSAIMFALFDITASILVLLGFLIFRWAVIAAPIIGTIAILRPASAGFRRLVNAVVAALFNIIIFGTGAAIYLFAFDLIVTSALPGWLQVVLVWLTGVVGWLLLRPYRRITQLGGRDPSAVVASAGSWHRRFFRDARETAPLAVAKPGGGSEPVVGEHRPQRIEIRAEHPVRVESDPAPTAPPGGRPAGTPRRMPAPSQGGWTEPAPDGASSYTLYRPQRSTVGGRDDYRSTSSVSGRSGARGEARLDE
jgi:hypothetical protein